LPGFAALAWHEVTALADANLDRLVHNAHRIEIKGEPMRKGKTPPSEK
jgi:DNA replication protein DnaC